MSSATAFRTESHLDTSPLFGILRPDLVDVRSEANPTGENMAIITENGNTSETAPPGSTRRRTTSGKDLQEVRAAAKVAIENNSSMSPSKEKEMAREMSQDGQKGRVDGDAARRLLPRDELIAYLQRGLLWQEAVQHANDDVRLEVKSESTIAHRILITLIAIGQLHRRIPTAQAAYMYTTGVQEVPANATVLRISPQASRSIRQRPKRNR